MSSSDAHDMSPPVMPHDPPDSELSRPAKIAWAVIALVVVSLAVCVMMNAYYAHDAAKQMKRNWAIRGIAQGLVIAEQSGMQMGEATDWKKTLIENGLVADEMFKSPDAVGGVKQYRIIWRPQTTKWIGTNFSWLCIYEDPASLRAGERVYLMVDNHVTSVQREDLLVGIQENLKQIGVELSEREVQELSER